MTSPLPIKKDPQAKLDYGWTWTPEIRPGDSITSSSWSITGTDTALTQSNAWFDAKETGVWLTGGTLGVKYAVTNHIVTAQGREDDRTFKVEIVQR